MTKSFTIIFAIMVAIFASNIHGSTKNPFKSNLTPEFTPQNNLKRNQKSPAVNIDEIYYAYENYHLNNQYKLEDLSLLDYGEFENCFQGSDDLYNKNCKLHTELDNENLNEEKEKDNIKKLKNPFRHNISKESNLNRLYKLFDIKSKSPTAYSTMSTDVSTHADELDLQEENENFHSPPNHEKRAKILDQKWKTFSKLLLAEQQSEINENSQFAVHYP